MSQSLLRSISTSPSSSLIRPTSQQIRTKTSTASPSSLWLSRTHLQPQPSIPPPVPPKYPMRVVLSDGSSFTAYTTAPTPSTKKLTRDVLNNPLWAPASERRGLGEGEEGRVGRFRKRFEGLGLDGTPAPAANAGAGANEQGGETKEGAFEENDLDWMSEGAQEEKISEKQRNPVKAAKKGGKKK
ncbi:hypothetical protein CI109_105256 [Kwoniella shandongensis]|uniref:Uncharacterized protein n=1 Tax=Kwoniella shandongensis TaxID=1734106 RepID=A0A5M6C3Y5_9TREE|nr:uncharacterized protein CI109_002099 [Kwoniella shandongensis]KAA5529673.1 hypothetical protein CI109_002099 [Kwoniella shandongensis]